MATVRFQLRGDTAAKWASINPILKAKEPALETDTLLVKYGDGTSTWNDLPYAALNLPAVLAAYANGDLPSSFTLSIVDSPDQTAWREAIDAQQADDVLTDLAGVTPIADGAHTVAGITITTAKGLIVSIA